MSKPCHTCHNSEVRFLHQSNIQVRDFTMFHFQILTGVAMISEVEMSWEEIYWNLYLNPVDRNVFHYSCICHSSKITGLVQQKTPAYHFRSSPCMLLDIYLFLPKIIPSLACSPESGGLNTQALCILNQIHSELGIIEICPGPEWSYIVSFT